MNGTPSSYVFRSYSTVPIDSGPYAVALFCTVSRIRGDLQGIRGTQGGPQRRLACSAAVLRPSWCGSILQGISSIVEPSPPWQVCYEHDIIVGSWFIASQVSKSIPKAEWTLLVF